MSDNSGAFTKRRGRTPGKLNASRLRVDALFYGLYAWLMPEGSDETPELRQRDLQQLAMAMADPLGEATVAMVGDLIAIGFGPATNITEAKFKNLLKSSLQRRAGTSPRATPYSQAELVLIHVDSYLVYALLQARGEVEVRKCKSLLRVRGWQEVVLKRIHAFSHLMRGELQVFHLA